MAEPEVVVAEEDVGDEDMVEAEIEEGDPTLDEGGPTGLEDIELTIPDRTTFLEYAKLREQHSVKARQPSDIVIATYARPLSN